MITHDAKQKTRRGCAGPTLIRMVHTFARSQRQIRPPPLVPDSRKSAIIIQEAGRCDACLFFRAFRRMLLTIQFCNCPHVDRIGLAMLERQIGDESIQYERLFT